MCSIIVRDGGVEGYIATRSYKVSRKRLEIQLWLWPAKLIHDKLRSRVAKKPQIDQWYVLKNLQQWSKVLDVFIQPFPSLQDQ